MDPGVDATNVPLHAASKTAGRAAGGGKGFPKQPVPTTAMTATTASRPNAVAEMDCGRAICGQTLGDSEAEQ
jgi:hypothetical protein